MSLFTGDGGVPDWVDSEAAALLQWLRLLLLGRLGVPSALLRACPAFC